MTTAEHIRLLNDWLDGTDIAVLELTTPHETLRLCRDDIPTDSPPIIVTAPSLGVFLHRHPLHTIPVTAPGQKILAGTVVGLLRIGKLLLEVPAPCDGLVEQIIAADGSTVGYGAPLLCIRST